MKCLRLFLSSISYIGSYLLSSLCSSTIATRREPIAIPSNRMGAVVPVGSITQ
jgi:hypothetical protein